MTLHATPRRRLFARREFLAALGSALGLVGAAVIVLPRLGVAPTTPAVDSDLRGLIGAPAPPLEARTLEGDTWNVADYSGRPVWINVWATWCPPCRTEMPEIDEVAREAAPHGLAFLALNFQEDQELVERYLENTGYGFTIGLDPTGELAERYGVRSLPAHIFIGRDGRLESVRVGGMTRAEMEERIRVITAGEAPSAAAEQSPEPREERIGQSTSIHVPASRTLPWSPPEGVR